jgi:membrane associated rhomboid family serine protease
MKARLPLVTLLLIVANVAAYLLELRAGGQATCEAFGLIPARFVRSSDLEPLLSSLFLHDPSSLLHLGCNMVFLAFSGVIVEGALGGLPFFGLYLAAGAVGGLAHVLVDPAATSPLVGASGAIFGVLAVAAAMRPRLLGFTVTFIGIEIWHAAGGGGGNVSFGCHLGGFFVGALVAVLLRATGSEALETAS